jgi:hypothetical protein
MVGSWLAGRFKSSVCVTIPVSFTESVPQPAVQLLLGDELQKIAQMLNFVTIVAQTRPSRVSGRGCRFGNCCNRCNRRSTTLPISFFEVEVKKQG